MATGTGFRHGRVIHLRRFPARLIMASPTVRADAAVVSILMALDTLPGKPGVVICFMALDAGKLEMIASKLTRVVRLGGPPALQVMTSNATGGQRRAVTLTVTGFAGAPIERVPFVLMAAGASGRGMLGDEEVAGLLMAVSYPAVPFMTLKANFADRALMTVERLGPGRIGRPGPGDADLRKEARRHHFEF